MDLRICLYPQCHWVTYLNLEHPPSCLNEGLVEEERAGIVWVEVVKLSPRSLKIAAPHILMHSKKKLQKQEITFLGRNRLQHLFPHQSMRSGQSRVAIVWKQLLHLHSCQCPRRNHQKLRRYHQRKQPTDPSRLWKICLVYTRRLPRSLWQYLLLLLRWSIWKLIKHTHLSLTGTRWIPHGRRNGNKNDSLYHLTIAR